MVRPRGRRVRLEDAVTFFLSEWPAEGPSAETVRTYGWQLKWLVAYAVEQKKLLLEDLTPQFLRSAMTAKRSAVRPHPVTHKGGEAAANSLACATRALVRWLTVQGVACADLSVVKPPRVPERVQTRVRQDEFKAIESAILHRLVEPDRRNSAAMIARDLALVYMLADTGLRASEVCGMTVRAVDFTTGSVVVTHGKGSKGRALSVAGSDDRTTLRLLAEWIAYRDSLQGTEDHELLWVSSKGKALKPAELRGVLAEICKRAGLEGNRPPHTFRRANFTEHYQADPASINVLISRMGWSHRSHHMVNTYTRGADVDLARTTPLPSVASRWQTSPEEGPSMRMLRPIIGGGVDSRGRKSNDPVVPHLPGRDTNRVDSRNSRRSSRPQINGN